MITTINEWRMQNELRRQQVIPFQEPEFKSKSIYGHLADAFIDLTVMKSDDYHSISNPQDQVYKVYNEAFANAFVPGGSYDNTLNQYVYQFIHSYNPIEDKELYNQSFIDDLLKEDESILDRSNAFEFVQIILEEPKLKDVFTEDGYKQFTEIAKDVFDEDVNNMLYPIQESYDSNEDGLIDCWRVVNYVADPDGDYYVGIMKHGGVGVYWSYDEKAAEAHWGEAGGHTITLHGKVSVENVDWLETVTKATYDLKEEKEIKIKDKGNVLIIGYTDNKNVREIILDQPVVVKAN